MKHVLYWQFAEIQTNPKKKWSLKFRPSKIKIILLYVYRKGSTDLSACVKDKSGKKIHLLYNTQQWYTLAQHIYLHFFASEAESNNLSFLNKLKNKTMVSLNNSQSTSYWFLKALLKVSPLKTTLAQAYGLTFNFVCSLGQIHTW